MSDMVTDFTKALESTVDEKITSVYDKFETAAQKRTEEMEELVRTGLKLKIRNGRKVHTIDGLKHASLTKLITAISQRLPSLMVGMAGTGKTHAAEQAAKAVGLEFYAMSVGAQTSKSDLMGFIHANGQYVPTLFRKAVEEGGVFLMDEMDAGNANVLIMVNSVLSNGYAAFPDRMVKVHENFVFVGSANTYGLGASRQYVGRNQLDAATLDRFVVIDWAVDENLEKALAGNDVLGKRWHKVVLELRQFVQREGLRILVTPRATIKGSTLLRAGLEFKEVLYAVLLSGAPQDKQEQLERIATDKWEDN